MLADISWSRPTIRVSYLRILTRLLSVITKQDPNLILHQGFHPDVTEKAHEWSPSIQSTHTVGNS